MDSRFFRGFALLILFGLFVSAAGVSGRVAVCARVSDLESILPTSRVSCPAEELDGVEAIGVIEGDEAALQRALHLVYKNREVYVAVLFQASWCPFSKICRPNFDSLASMFPTIRHFAFEESVIRPSILSRDVTGVKPASLDLTSVERMADSFQITQPEEAAEQENCPFLWARSPERLLHQHTYLALASSFVLLRLLHLLIPKLNACIKRAWRRYMQYASLQSLLDHFHASLEEAKQGFNRLNPCKRSNLKEGAMNAKAWASKSLASVSIGEPSMSRAQLN